MYNFRRTIHIWQSGNKFRTDHDTPVSDCPSCQYRNITCLNGEGDQSAFLCSYNLANPTEIAASLQKKSTDPKKQANYIIVDARKIAASWKSPIEHFTFTDPESILFPDARSDLQIIDSNDETLRTRLKNKLAFREFAFDKKLMLIS